MTTDTLVLRLVKPIEFAGETITELRLREPLVEEYDKATTKAGSQVQVTTHLLFLITGVSLAAIGKMGMRDFTRAADFLAGFLGGGPADGAAESPTSPDGSAGALAIASASR